MEQLEPKQLSVLLTGNNRLIFGAAVCLTEAGHPVSLHTENRAEAAQRLFDLHAGMEKYGEGAVHSGVSLIENLGAGSNASLAIAFTSEDARLKKQTISLLEKKVHRNTIIAINAESIVLSELQQGAVFPERICVLNWTEPAHTTFFLELVVNDTVRKDIPPLLTNLASFAWNKDPYTTNEYGVRSRLLSAITREAFYLIENGYVTVEDIDRACRNDAGYYLPFAGNCRYMDLMGTRAYGMVMKDLNPDLSNADAVPDFFAELVAAGDTGMAAGKGLYEYTDEDKEQWKDRAERFGHDIRAIINRYP